MGEYSTSDFLCDSSDQQTQIRNHIVSSSYTKFVNQETGLLSAMLVESSMREEFLNSSHFMEYEQFVLLYNQTITLLNMIPKDIKNLIRLSQSNIDYYAFKKMEILEGNSISEFAIGKPQELIRMLQKNSVTKEEESEFKSLLEQILDGDQEDSKRRSFLRDNQILRDKGDLSFDFTFKSTLERCMEGGPQYHESAEVIFKHLLS